MSMLWSARTSVSAIEVESGSDAVSFRSIHTQTGTIRLLSQKRVAHLVMASEICAGTNMFEI